MYAVELNRTNDSWIRPFAAAQGVRVINLAICLARSLDRSDDIFAAAQTCVDTPVEFPFVRAAEFVSPQGKALRSAVFQPSFHSTTVSSSDVIYKYNWGSLTLWSCEPVGLDLLTEFLAQQLAQAASTIHLRDTLRKRLSRLHRIREGLATRKRVHRACGVLASHWGITESVALGRIRTLARDTCRPVREIADSVIAADQIGSHGRG